MDIEELTESELNQLLNIEENLGIEKNKLDTAGPFEYEVKNFGDLVEGDYIQGPDGSPVEITSVYEKHIPETMYEIEIEDGNKIKVSGNHLWYVETENNLAMHHNRVKEARKYLKNKLSSENINQLLDVANSDEDIETALIDMVAAINSVNNNEGVRIVARIARSLGKVSDNNEMLKNYETDEILSENNIPYYDGKLFCQQILALYDKKYARKWKIRKGEVVTTEELLDFYDTANLPVIEKL